MGCGQYWRRRLPILTWLPQTTWSDVLADHVAGVTVGLTLIPQVIAYAALAGLSPQYGLYSGLMGGLVYVVFGSTKQLCVGPTALVSLLTFNYTQDTNIQMVVTLTFLCGLVELVCGVLQLGVLVQFVSVPVVSGFTSAAAVIIASSQVKGLFGLNYKSKDFLSTWALFFQHVHNTQIYDLALGSLCIASLLLLRKIKDVVVPGYGKPSISSPSWLSRTLWFLTTGRNALVVLTCIALCYFLEEHLGRTPFTLTLMLLMAWKMFIRLPDSKRNLDLKWFEVKIEESFGQAAYYSIKEFLWDPIDDYKIPPNHPASRQERIDAGLPGFINPLPSSTMVNNQTLTLYEMVTHLGSGLLVIPLISIISNVAISKAFAQGQVVDATQEIIALGLCNILGAFIYSLPVAGSFTRSAVNSASGVRTQLRGVVTSVVVTLALVFITPYFHYIPRPTLSAVIMCAVLFMIEVELLRPMWNSNRRDLIPAISTFMACLVLGVEIGFGVGILVDVGILLYYNARPRVIIKEEKITNESAEVVYWNVIPQGSMLFPSIDHIRRAIVAKARSHTEQGVRVSGVVLDCTMVMRSDFSAAQGLQGVLEDIRSLGIPLILSYADPVIVKSLTGVCQDSVLIAHSERELFEILTREVTL